MNWYKFWEWLDTKPIFTKIEDVSNALIVLAFILLFAFAFKMAFWGSSKKDKNDERG